MDETRDYDKNDFVDADIGAILDNVFNILEERGYNPIKQITGYLISNDPGYITSHKDARNIIMAYDRTEIIEFLLRKTYDR